MNQPARFQFGIRSLLLAALVVALGMSAWLGFRGWDRLFPMLGVALLAEHLIARFFGQRRPWFLLHLLVLAASLVLSVAVAIIWAIVLVKFGCVPAPVAKPGTFDLMPILYWLLVSILAFYLWCAVLLLYTIFRYVKRGTLGWKGFLAGTCAIVYGALALAHNFAPEMIADGVNGVCGEVIAGFYCAFVCQTGFWILHRGTLAAQRLSDALAARWQRWEISRSRVTP